MNGSPASRRCNPARARIRRSCRRRLSQLRSHFRPPPWLTPFRQRLDREQQRRPQPLHRVRCRPFLARRCRPRGRHPVPCPDLQGENDRRASSRLTRPRCSRARSSRLFRSPARVCPAPFRSPHQARSTARRRIPSISPVASVSRSRGPCRPPSLRRFTAAGRTWTPSAERRRSRQPDSSSRPRSCSWPVALARSCSSGELHHRLHQWWSRPPSSRWFRRR